MVSYEVYTLRVERLLRISDNVVDPKVTTML